MKKSFHLPVPPAKIASACLCLALIAANARANSLMLDFGPTAVAATNNTLSMGHFAGAIPASETGWNTVTVDTSSLVYSDGTAATGVSVDVGRSDIGINDTVNFNNNAVAINALGGQISAGIYIGSSPVRDGILPTAVTGGAAVNTNALGIRINGLAAGPYTIYISGRNTSTAVSAAQRFFCRNGPSATSFSFNTNTASWVDEANSATPPGSAPNSSDAITSTFAYGDNCVHLTVTLGAGESLFLSAVGIATNEYRGFLNAVQIVSGAPVLTNFPPVVGKQPANATVYEGATVNITNVTYGGLPALSYRWLLNSNGIPDATNSTLILSNITAAQAGTYAVSVSNSVGQAISANATVSIIPLFNTGQMSNLWNLLPGDRFYITATNNNSGERGLAYNPVSSNLLVDCQIPSNNLVVLDSATGAEKYFMNLTGITAGAAGLNMIGVADDGAVYGGNATANASQASTPYLLWRWADDGSNTMPAQLLSGDPGFSTPAAGLRWGDNLAVRGSGAGTQILIAPGTGTNVCIFTTGDGTIFTQNILSIDGVPSGFGQFGVSFGAAGSNTFWAKTLNQQLYLIQFDINLATGSVLRSYSNGIPNNFRLIATDGSQTWLAGIMSVASGLPDNVRLYNISDLAHGPVLADQELYSTQNPNTFLNGAGTGSTAFGGNYVFALDSQNGIKAFLLNANFAPGLDPYSIASIAPQNPASVTLTWQSVAGHTYQVQFKTNLLDAAWTDVGSAISASGTTTSFTNAISGGIRLYRIRGQ